MKAWAITETGGPEVLVQRELESRDPAPGEVKIAVRAFGVNAAERYRRLGVMGPIDGIVVPGIEAVGEVLSDPSGRFEAGAKVATMMGGLQFDRTGSYAEEVVVRGSNVVALPDTTLGWAELAALPQSYLTAWGAIEQQLRIREGMTLVVRGAGSALGLAAVSFAATIVGARVIATVRHVEQFDELARLGAAVSILESENLVDQILELSEGGADGVLDIIGGPGIVASSRLVRPFGAVAVVGLLAGPPVLENVNLMTDLGMGVSVGFFRSEVIGTPALPIDGRPLADVIRAIEDGRLPSLVARQYEFSDVRALHEDLEGSRSAGKLVVTI